MIRDLGMNRLIKTLMRRPFCRSSLSRIIRSPNLLVIAALTPSGSQLLCNWLGRRFLIPREGVMHNPEFEYMARRVAQDLNVGNEIDAANVLRQEIYQDPCNTRALVNRAYQLSSPYRQSDILVSNFGDVAVRDRYNGYQAYAGRIPQYCEPRYPGPGPGYPIPIPIPIPIPLPFPRGGHGHGGHGRYDIPHRPPVHPHPGHPGHGRHR